MFGVRARLLGSAVALGITAGLVALGSAHAAPSAASTGDFTAINPPLSGAVDYITGMPSAGIGPVGVLDDGTSFFVTDFINHSTYKYAVGSTVPLPLVTSAANGLDHGIAVLSGKYYGIGLGALYQFDPNTLALGKKIVAAPCGDTRGLAADPDTGDLIIAGSCGLYRVSDPDGATPTMTAINTDDNLDGVTVTDGGTAFWVADVSIGGVAKISASGTVLDHVAIAGGPDGVAIASSSATAGVAGNLFVNDNNGSITMVDVHHGDATTVVASGGSRGDFVTVGPDGFLYATQADRVEQIQPSIFVPVVTTTSPTPPTTTTQTTTSTTTTTPDTSAVAQPSTAAVTPTTTAGSGTQLAATGAGPIGALLAIGGLAILAGGLVVFLARRRGRA
jgi:hypothetical protein